MADRLKIASLSIPSKVFTGQREELPVVWREVLRHARPGLGLHLLVRVGIRDLVLVGLPRREIQETQGPREDLARLGKVRFVLDDEDLLSWEVIEPALQLLGVEATC